VVTNEGVSQRRVGGEMEVGEEHLLRTKEIVLGRDRFLDLDDHLRAVKDLRG
jgi:hypothetical protein